MVLNELFNDIVKSDVKVVFNRYYYFILEGKEVNRFINDMIYFVRDIIMNKMFNEFVYFELFIYFDLDMLYRMIDIINDILVFIRFSVN